MYDHDDDARAAARRLAYALAYERDGAEDAWLEARSWLACPLSDLARADVLQSVRDAEARHGFGRPPAPPVGWGTVAGVALVIAFMAGLIVLGLTR